MELQKGFHELIPPHLLKDFDERELELLVSGLGKVDVEDWRNNTRLKNCSPDTDTIKWFWKVSSVWLYLTSSREGLLVIHDNHIYTLVMAGRGVL